MNRLLYILVFLMTIGLTDVSAQVDKRDVRRGNRDFKKENFKEAELDYFRALVKDSLSFAANYNMANTLYRQENYDQAMKHLEKIAEAAVASPAAADYYYNLGNVAMAKEDYQKAVDAYKQSLLRNPADLEAKENYIYAKEKLKQQQDQQNQQNDQNQDQQNQQNDQNQDQNKDQQDSKDDQNKDQQDQNDDQNKNDQNKNDQNKEDQQDKQNQQGQQPKISPQAAKQMLQAIQAKEKETQEKVNKEKAAALSSRQKEKNW